jgi:hypothetical protein
LLPVGNLKDAAGVHKERAALPAASLLLKQRVLKQREIIVVGLQLAEAAVA